MNRFLSGLSWAAMFVGFGIVAAFALTDTMLRYPPLQEFLVAYGFQVGLATVFLTVVSESLTKRLATADMPTCIRYSSRLGIGGVILLLGSIIVASVAPKWTHDFILAFLYALFFSGLLLLSGFAYWKKWVSLIPQAQSGP